jgi:hypothetical protein
MKAILEFNLPDDEDEFRIAINGRCHFGAAWDAYQTLRRWTKYDHVPSEAEMQQLMAEIEDSSKFDEIP